MKKFFVSLFLLALMAAVALGFYGVNRLTAAGPLPSEKIILIEKGTGLRSMAAQLKAADVIVDQWVFMAAAGVTGDNKKLQAGEYLFPAHITMKDVIAKIAKGDVFQRRFTIPEGKTSFEIVAILNKAEALKGEVGAVPAEGSLLPETYSYLPGDTRAGKVAAMQDAMRKTIEDLWPGRVRDLPFTTVEEAVTLASIVEKETGIASERKRVAGVFIDRLKIGMPLQTDPTVIYGLTKGEHKNEGQGPLGRRLLLSDLRTPSPYNTYLNPGLPPTPIANPGRASIEAVLHPEKHDFLYFVADGKGGHIFASTLAQHNRNVAQWRKIRKNR